MFSRILTAIHDATSDRPLFERAIALAQKFDAQVLLVHVLTQEMLGGTPTESYIPYAYPILSDELLDRYQQEGKALEQAGLDLLRTLQEEAETQGVTAELSQNFGNPGRTICYLAKSWRADLILIGRRGRTGLSELLLGSVSNYVMHHAPCSVLTVQNVNNAELADREPLETSVTQTSVTQ